MIGRPAVVIASLLLATFVVACNQSASTPSSSSSTAATETFASRIGPGGAATRGFRSAAGAVSLTLTELRPAVLVGLGLGVPRADGTSCLLTRSVETLAATTAHVTLAVDGGSYCVKVWDVGTIVDYVDFTVSIAHP